MCLTLQRKIYRGNKNYNMIKLANFKQVLLLVLGLFVFFKAVAQKGSIEGVVFDKVRNETLVGANVIIEGTTMGTITDFDGRFLLPNLAPGTYNVLISFISYQPVVLQSIKVEANKSTVIKAELQEITTAIEGVTVTAARKTNTEMAMISTIKASLTVASGISAQQITRSQDRDASEVIRRVPGVSIIDDRFVVVRGLNQRYNNAWINNASTPSSEADQKAFSFDVIPSAMIDNMVIYKSPSPELPADFTGGFIKIFTKNMPEEDFFSIGYTTGYNTSTDYQNVKLITRSSTDWLGYDNGTRNLPEKFPSTLKGLTNTQLANYGKMLNSYWAPNSVNAYPDQKANVSFGKKWQKGNRRLGNITSITYSNTYETDALLNKGYQVQLAPGINPPLNFDFVDSTYVQNVKIGLLHNWSLFTGKSSKIEFRNLFNLIAKNKTIVRNGYSGYEGYTIRSYQDNFMNRTTYSTQLGGEHRWGENSNNKIDWIVGYALSYRNEPDLKQLRTTLQDEPLLPHYNEYYAGIGLTPSVSDAGRLYMKLIEHVTNAGVNFERQLNIGNWKPTLKSGIYSEFKMRSFDARILGFAKNSSYTESVWLPIDKIFSLENINTTPDGFLLKESTSKSDSYEVNSLLNAGYASVNTKITEKLSIFGGIRAEWVNQQLNSYDRYGMPITAEDKSIDLFPSANLTFNFSEKNLLRLAAGLSINRPEFREIAPFYFYNFNEEAEFVGNPDIKNCYIWNYDLRWEIYPSSGETFSIGTFYKKFNGPIELIFKPAGNRFLFTYENASDAYSMGVEMDLRKSLESIGFLKNFYIVANAAYIHSQVVFPKESIFRNRPMQGQSPYVVNAGIFYQNEKQKLSVSVQYNIIGDRILAVGIPFQNQEQDIPDYYEKHQHLLDVTLTKQFGKHVEIKAGVKNLLNQKINIYQPFKGDNGSDMNLDNKISSPGISFSIGTSIRF